MCEKCKDIISKPPLGESDIIKYQNILRSIGERKIRGFIFIATMQDDTFAEEIATDKRDKAVGGDGLLFTQHVTGPTMVLNLVKQVGMSAGEVLSIL